MVKYAHSEADDLVVDNLQKLKARIKINGSREDGYLSNLVSNVRNRYLAVPNSPFTSQEVRWLVEGFIAELVERDNEQERHV